MEDKKNKQNTGEVEDLQMDSKRYLKDEEPGMG